MCVDFCFEKTLDYSSPAHGGWGIVRVAALVPQSHILFTCPSDCFRHGSLGAVQHGYKYKVSYLGLEPADVISGYDNLMIEALTELSENPTHDTKAIFFFAGCIDDFVGTDKEAIARTMSEKFPDILFIPAFMNPIDSDSKKPPMVNALHSMLSIVVKGIQKGWHSAEKTNTVNLLGNFAPIEEQNEVFDFFKFHGMRDVLQVGNHQTMDSYLALGQSKLNVCLSPICWYTAEMLEKELSIPSVNTFISYDMEEIEAGYRAIEEKLNDGTSFDFSKIRNQLSKKISWAKTELNNLPILVSGSAVLRPFSLAKALLTYGFNVVQVNAVSAIGPDNAAFEYIKNSHPEITIVQTQHHKAAKMHSEETEDILAIGYEGAYLGNAAYVVDLVDDEEMYGFYGIEKLMDKMVEASKERINLKHMIEEYGAVV